MMGANSMNLRKYFADIDPYADHELLSSFIFSLFPAVNDERLQAILMNRLGLFDWPIKTLVETAKETNSKNSFFGARTVQEFKGPITRVYKKTISPARVQQLERIAIQKIRNYMNNDYRFIKNKNTWKTTIPAMEKLI